MFQGDQKATMEQQQIINANNNLMEDKSQTFPGKKENVGQAQNQIQQQQQQQLQQSQLQSNQLQSNLIRRPCTSVQNQILKTNQQINGVEEINSNSGNSVSTSQTSQVTYQSSINGKTGNQKKSISPSKQIQQQTQLPDINIKKQQSDKIPYTNFQKNKQTTENLSNQLVGTEYSDILLKEKDERFRYLIKHGILKRIVNNGNLIFSELPQIQGIWVCYRRPIEREQNLEKLNLDYMDLPHIPLLEGEEKLKILTYQHNRIQKIENLVSLPALLYLDLYDNMIKDIDNLNSINQLRVLLLPKNDITKIKNLDMLVKLEVLDLHSNKITKIEGISKLTSLRILNLANNQLTKLEGLEAQTGLVELNIKINQIEVIENIQHLNKLEKLFLSKNKIKSVDSFKELRNLVSLTEINLDDNPIFKIKAEYLRALISAIAKTVTSIDHKSIDKVKEELRQEENRNLNEAKNKQQQSLINLENKRPNKPLAGQQRSIEANNQGQQNQENNNELDTGDQQVNQNKESIQGEPGEQQDQLQNNINQNDNQEDDEENINPEEVISIIGQQWKKELDRVKQLDLNNANKKDMLKGTLVEGGHAEIEDDTILFIYGNAYEIVLNNKTFQEQIEKIQFQYILFDFLIESQTLNTLKQFIKLKEIVLKDNQILSLLQLAKLEILPSLKSITIENSPVTKCSFLREFIVYRFPNILKINGKEIKETDKLKAKNLFHQFDRILQLPEKFYSIENIREFNVIIDQQNGNPGQQQQQQQTGQQQSIELKKDKQYMKLFTKLVSDISEKFSSNLITTIQKQCEQEKQINQIFDEYMLSLIIATTQK